MTEKEINLKSVLFLVIGLLLLLSLVICIYIVNGEKDLISIEAKVIDVQKDENGTGKNNITVSYEIDETSYNYNFNYKDNINLDDKIVIYYHENNINSVTTFKTTKFIFVFPIIGLFLCIISLFELFRQGKDDILFQTAVIDISGTTQKLEIVTDDTVVKEYESLPEEQVEVGVKKIKKENKSPEKEEPKSSNNNKKQEPQEVKEDWYIEVNDDQSLNNDKESKKAQEVSQENQSNINIEKVSDNKTAKIESNEEENKIST